MEELKRLRSTVALTNTNISDLNKGFKALKENFETISEDLDAFINVYEFTQERVETRLKRLEKHTGLD